MADTGAISAPAPAAVAPPSALPAGRGAGSLGTSGSLAQVMMWEEHPEYQKQQARLIGILLLLLLVGCVVSFIVARDWDSLKQVLLFAGAFVIVPGLFSGGAWLGVKFFTRKPPPDSKRRDGHPGR